MGTAKSHKITELELSEEALRDLMLKSQSGDKLAYSKLLKELDSLILRYCLRALPSESLALDCKQDVLLSIHRMLHTYDPKRSFFAWLYAIIKNKVIDYYRKTGRLKKREIIDSDLMESGESPVGPDKDEAKMTVNNLLRKLPEKFREPLVLSKLYGFSVKEIAKQANISQALVKVRVHRGLKRLQKILEEDSAFL